MTARLPRLQTWLCYIAVFILASTISISSALLAAPTIWSSKSVLAKLTLLKIAVDHHDDESDFVTSNHMCKKSFDTLPRIYVGQEISALYKGAQVPLTMDQAHYLTRVHRIRPKRQQHGVEDDSEKQSSISVRVFNEANGEWLGQIIQLNDKNSKNKASKINSAAYTELIIECVEQIRRKEHCVTVSSLATCWVLFSPIRKERMKILVEKCTELGVHGFIPLRTSRTVSTNIDKLDIKKMRSQIIEASEQCERLSIPKLVINPLASFLNNNNTQEMATLSEVLLNWDTLNLLRSSNSTSIRNAVAVVCRERESGEYTRPITETLSELSHVRSDVFFLIGPEGGWSPEEESIFDNNSDYPFIRSVSLVRGLVLRSETAAIVAAGAFLSSIS
jgi:16S rRNA (uracil1498-N3)-methyltransferase